MKLNSHIAFYLLFALLFASCATSPTSTVSATPIPSETPQPTQTATETPTLTPTATENPLAGAPDGTTGKNSNGQWVKTVENVTYIYKTVTNAKRNEIIAQGWFWNDGSAPLTTGSHFGTSSSINIWCEEGVDCLKMTHPSNYIDPGTGLSFSTAMYSQIEAQDIGKPI